MFGMRFIIIFTPIVAMTVLTAAFPVAELDRKTSGMMIIPLTKRLSLLKTDNTLDTLSSHVQTVHTYVTSTDVACAKDYFNSKIQRGFENYEKNMGVPHPLAVKGFESKPLNLKRASAAAAAALTNFGNSDWYTTISVGTPPRPFTGKFKSMQYMSTLIPAVVNIDTGSPLVLSVNHIQSIC
jgi:hypothetical protein